MNDEEEKKEAEKKAAEEAKAKEASKPTENAETGDKGNKEPSMIDGAVLAAEELRKQNDRKEELLDREEKLQAQRVLGGQTEAGTEQKKTSEEDLKKERAKEYFKDTALGDAIAKT